MAITDVTHLLLRHYLVAVSSRRVRTTTTGLDEECTFGSTGLIALHGSRSSRWVGDEPRRPQSFDASGIELPKNEGKPPDHKLRKADCAVLNWYMSLTEQENVPYDTVRGSFQEGKPVFDGSLINGESHIQIAVRNPECILGVFRPTAFSSFS
jgi:hypothetical protein